MLVFSRKDALDKRIFLYFCFLIALSMSEQIKHECGIALIRLLKPLEFYLAKYGTLYTG